MAGRLRQRRRLRVSVDDKRGEEAALQGRHTVLWPQGPRMAGIYHLRKTPVITTSAIAKRTKLIICFHQGSAAKRFNAHEIFRPPICIQIGQMTNNSTAASANRN
eukprot:scaffold30426_cov25-Prasinocladus_malaysianus.AAC.4